MKNELQDLLKNPADIVHNLETLKTKPKTPQQKFYHTIAHITLLKKKILASEFEELFNKYCGSLSCKILSYRYMSYCMENKLIDKYYHFKILSVLSSWIDRLQKLKKQEKLRLMYTVAIDLHSRGTEGIEDSIVYLNYIGIDLVELLQKSQQPEISQQDNQNQTKIQKQPQLIRQNYLDVADVLVFTSGVLPKILHNIKLSNDFFPHSFLPVEAPTIDLIYSNENLQMLARSRPHYQRLIKTLLKFLLNSQTDQNQTKQLVLLTFRYYYIFHFDKSLGANQMVIEGLKKMTPSVQFAICDEILLFLTIIKKLGKDLFINYLANKFDWLPALVNKLNGNPIIGVAKDLVKPFPGSQLNLSLKINVVRGQIQTRYFEVYHKFSLFFYKIKVQSEDITIRMYYLGPFDSPTQKKEILLSKQKETQELKDCIQVIKPGIYCFEFDNTYSWIKAKNISIQWSILVPLQIVEDKKRPFLPVLFGNIEENSVPQNKILKIIDQDSVNEHQFWRHESNFVRVTWNKTEKLFNITMILPNYTYEFQSQNRKLLKRKFEKIGKMNEKNQYLQWWIDKKKFKTWEEGLKEMQEIERQLRQNELEEEKQEQQPSYQHSSDHNQQNFSGASDLQQQQLYELEMYKNFHSNLCKQQQQHRSSNSPDNSLQNTPDNSQKNYKQQKFGKKKTLGQQLTEAKLQSKQNKKFQQHQMKKQLYQQDQYYQ